MPHSDDEWIGCGFLLINNHMNSKVINMNMPGGDSKEIHEKRLMEAQEIARNIGYDFITVNDREEELYQIIVKEKPSCIFVPSCIDWHEEHFKVMEILKKAAVRANYSGYVGMYQVSIPIPETLINSGTRISNSDLRRKWRILPQYYRTQKFIPTFRFAMNEYINGKISGSYALESYGIFKFDEWINVLDKYIPSLEDRRFLKENINNIRKLRRWLKTKG